MVEEKKTESQDIQFPLNKRLLEESAKIKEERKVIKERLAKIEKSKGSVSELVYKKVRSDYVEQLNKNTNELLEKKQDIDRELSSLFDAQKKVSANVATHKERLEELNFRQGLGEFKKDEFHKIADEENEKLGKFEKILAAIENNIKQYRSLFEGEEEIFGGQEEAPPPPPPPSVHDMGKVTRAITEEEYHTGHDEGYFSAVTEEVVDETSKEIVAPPVDEGDMPPAKLTIVEGTGKGEVVELTAAESTIGRASSNAVVLKEAKVSRQHALIKRQGVEYLIEDLHSSNGVIVNDEKVQSHVLGDGDIIRIGDFALKFEC